jgi:hypothetical protein
MLKLVCIHRINFTWVMIYHTFILVVVGFELRASLTRQVLYQWAMPPDLFTFIVLGIEYCAFVWASLDFNLPIYASHVAAMTGTYHHTQLICWDGISLIFCLGWLQTRILSFLLEYLGLHEWATTHNFYIIYNIIIYHNFYIIYALIQFAKFNEFFHLF